jgi:hypothetical protein
LSNRVTTWGSFTGKDIKNFKNYEQFTSFFHQFKLILISGKWKDCELKDHDIEELCKHFQTVFLLWDGVFASARKINPMPEDAKIYGRFVKAIVAGHPQLELAITPKVHLMLKHWRSN